MADTSVARDQLRTIVERIERLEEAKKAISAFKVQVGKSGRFVAQGAVQLHGGMGFTEDLHLAQYYKRLVCCAALYGDADHHLAEYLSSKRRASIAA